MKLHVLGEEGANLADVPVEAITPDDVRDVIERLERVGKHAQAARIFALLKQMFRLTVKEKAGNIERSPAADRDVRSGVLVAVCLCAGAPRIAHERGRGTHGARGRA